MQGLNVSPVKPHLHANLMFVCTVFFFLLFTFMFTVVCDDVWIFSIIVSHRIVPADCFLPPRWTMMSIFVVTDWTVGLTEEELANGDSFSGQLRCQAPPLPLHLHRADGLNAGTVEKARWFRWLELDGAWQVYRERRSHFVRRCQYSSLAHYHYNSNCIIVYRWLNLLLNVRETSEMVKY